MTSKLHPIFAECVAKESTRFAIDHVFSEPDGFIYATDGCICVRTKGELPSIYGRTPDCSKLEFGRDKYALDPVNLNALEAFACLKCEGDRDISCEECDGRGHCDCSCGNHHDCEACDGVGTWSCPSCNAEGNSFSHPTFDIAGRFIAMFLRHGAMLFDRIDGNPSAAPRYFTVGDSIEGLVMPLDKKAREKALAESKT